MGQLFIHSLDPVYTFIYIVYLKSLVLARKVAIVYNLYFVLGWVGH